MSKNKVSLPREKSRARARERKNAGRAWKSRNDDPLSVSLLHLPRYRAHTRRTVIDLARTPSAKVRLDGCAGENCGFHIGGESLGWRRWLCGGKAAPARTIAQMKLWLFLYAIPLDRLIRTFQRHCITHLLILLLILLIVYPTHISSPDRSCLSGFLPRRNYCSCAHTYVVGGAFYGCN